jgi:hypothetical protein
VQLLKSKNISTIGDLCSLTANQINELPFRVPKSENVLRVLQAFHKALKDDEETSVPMDTASEATKQPVDDIQNLGSMEDEMAKLEETQSLDTSIECEAQTSESPDDKTRQPHVPVETSASDGDCGLDKITKLIVNNLTRNDGFNLHSIDERVKELNGTDLLALLNHVNRFSMRLMEINNCILQNISRKNDK